MASNYFSQFNREYLFELPQELLDLPKEEKYLSTAAAAAKYGDEIVPIIAYGISTNHSPKAKTERNGWVATEQNMINVPYHQLPELERMMNDANAVKLCKQGHLGIQFIGYTNEWGDQFKVKWVDM